MKTKNDLKTGILIGIGMIVIPLIIMSSKPITSPHNVTPESHVWDIRTNESDSYLFNKKTGEVKILSRVSPTKKGVYVTMSEWKE